MDFDLSDRLSHPKVIRLQNSLVKKRLTVKGTDDQIQRLVTSTMLTIQQYLKLQKYPPKPHPNIELMDAYQSLHDLIRLLQTKNWDAEILASHINSCTMKDLLILQGMRVTEGSIFTTPFFPNLKELYTQAIEPYNEYLSKVSRARSKHAHRCEQGYWGSISGSPDEQNNDASRYVVKLFQSYTWWNRFGHFKHNEILELRDQTGHGMRWDYSENSFLGLVEPIDPNLGEIF